MKEFLSQSSLRIFIAATVTLAVCMPTNASTVLEEIVVTAQKRVESLQDIPISASVASGADIQNGGISKLEDLTLSIPNITIAEAALGDLLFIRGVGSGQNNGFEQSVGTFIDGLYFGRGLQTRNAFLDVDRVELLRGPQSTFFGNNTVAGALNIITKLPDLDESDGYIQAAYEDGADKAGVDFAFGSPIGGTFAVRVAGLYSDQDGWQTNSTIGDNEPREEKLAGRISALWSPSETFEAVARIQVESTDTKGRAMQATGCPPPDGQPPAGYCLAYGVIQPSAGGAAPDFAFDDRRNGGNGASPFPTDEDFNDLDNLSGSLRLTWTLGEHDLTWLAGYSDYDNHRSQSAILLAGAFPAAPLPFANIEHLTEDFEQISHELRLTSPVGGAIEYVAGLYFQSNELQVVNDFSAATFATRLSDHRQEEESLSAFASATWHLSDKFRAALGLRYTDVDKDVVRDQILAENQGNLVLANAVPMQPTNPFFGAFVFGFGWQTGSISASRNDDDFLPSINFQYDINDNVLGYVSYAKGFKAGGFDEQNGRLDLATFGFEPEEAESYEVGLKTVLLDGSMRFNVAAFYSEFTNLQQQTFDGVINFLVTNAASASSRGLEADLTWQATESLRIAAQVAFLDAKNEDRVNGQCTTSQAAGIVPGCDFSDPSNPRQDLSGEPLTFSPDYSGSVTADYVHTFSNGYELATQVAITFEDDFFQTDDNDPFLVQEAYAKYNASIRLTSDSRRWELALIGKNLSDKRTSHFGNDLPLSSGSYFQFLDKPRTVALQGRFNF